MKPRRRYWTDDEEQFVADWYPHVPTQVLADALRCGPRRVYCKANDLGLHKTSEAMAEMSRTHMRRPDHGGRRTWFARGASPWNKGTRYQPGGRSVETRFQAGRPPCMSPNWVPIGSLRINAEGTLERKVTDDRSIVSARRWVPVARLVWESAHGPIPPGHSVVFRCGRRTTNVDEITPDALELLTRAELMARNSVSRYPPELQQVIQLRGALNRRINDIARKARKA